MMKRVQIGSQTPQNTMDCGARCAMGLAVKVRSRYALPAVLSPYFLVSCQISVTLVMMKMASLYSASVSSCS